MNQTAQNLASQGRNGDSMLVHMAPSEVRGLQALAQSQGESLSINPNTGLPEAFKLKQLLPMVIGAALTPFMGPMAAGLVTGGIETARTGDLGRGIMAGLGAFGGAGLASGLSAAGAATAGAGAGSAGVGTGELAMSAVPKESLISQSISAPPIPEATKIFGATPPGGGLFPAANIPPPAAPPSLGNMSTGFQNIFSPGATGTTARTAFMEGTKAALPGTASQLAATAGIAGNLAPEVKPVNLDKQEEKDAYEGFKRRFGYDPRVRQYPIPGMAFGGNVVDPSDEMTQDGGFARGGIPIKEGSFIMPARETAEFGNGSSNAGLAALSRMGARPIYGPGDGVSDSIRANIGGKQEARVARDEAYFPPEAVARIGKGSHKKGTKKLYAMMKAAQEARKKADRGQDTGLRGLLA